MTPQLQATGSRTMAAISPGALRDRGVQDRDIVEGLDDEVVADVLGLPGALGEHFGLVARPGPVELGRHTGEDVVRPAVVVALELHHLRAACVGSRKSHGDLVHLGARGVEPTSSAQGMTFVIRRASAISAW